jgi:hypothetical protein
VSEEVFRNQTFEMLVELVQELRDAVLGLDKENYQKPEKMLNFWSSHRQPFVEVKESGPPDIDRRALEHAADQYLRLPYRCAEFERLIIDMLAAAEMYAYGAILPANPPSRLPKYCESAGFLSSSARAMAPVEYRRSSGAPPH